MWLMLVAAWLVNWLVTWLVVEGNHSDGLVVNAMRLIHVDTFFGHLVLYPCGLSRGMLVDSGDASLSTWLPVHSQLSFLLLNGSNVEYIIGNYFCGDAKRFTS